MLATGFSVLLGFIIFLAFQAYDDTRAGAETEAAVVAQMVQTAQLMPAGSSEQLTGELICYGRSVVGTEWDAVASGRLQDSINPWGAAMFETVAALEPATDTEQSAYDRWMAQTSERQQARNDRVHTARGHHPDSAVAGALRHLRGDLRLPAVLRRQRRGAITQAVLMGSVTVVITVLMLLLGLLRQPARRGPRRAAAHRHGALAAHRRQPGRRPRHHGHAPVRRAGTPAD